MTIQKDRNSTNNSQKKHVYSLSLIILILQHIPIAMITKTCNRKQSCYTVTYCPLVTAWATTIHKFQVFKAGFDPNDEFKYLIVNPGDLTTEQQNPGILYTAMSHAKTMGQMTPNNPHPKDSAIFWTGLGISKIRVLNITKKRGLDGNITNCLKINKRQEWVNHLLKQSQLTSSGQYSERRGNKIEKKMPKKLNLLEHVDFKQAIAEIITNPNENWKKLKREKYITEKSNFQK
jgi:hypothetical protein